MSKKIITISREFGSGGRTIGKELANKLNISFYDKALIEKISAESGFNQKFIEDECEYSPSNNMFSYAFVGRAINGMSPNDYLWTIQHKVILDIAQKEACVIVGRCADYILRERTDCLNVFIHSSFKNRADRITTLYGKSDKSPEKRLLEKDKKRKINYKYYTEQDWGMSQNYHISLDSGEIGLDNCINIIYNLYNE